jgi:tRNA modification GTPase
LPGEFTRRAFLTGRIDLAQAEAVLDIIRAKTDSALKVGMEQLRGELSKKINTERQKLLEVLSVLEANIDFPDEELGAQDLSAARKKIDSSANGLKNILSGSRHGRVYREGIRAVICGKPNVGKSSLLNALLKQERSIVTPVAGTTRDTVEEIIDIRGIPVRVVDTAGIIEPRDLVEKKAIQRSRRHLRLADLVILVLDGSRRLSKEDRGLMTKVKGKPVVAVINKMDLKQKIESGVISGKFVNTINVCAKKSKNIGLLEDRIAELVFKGEVSGPEPVMVSNMRHIEKLRQAQILIAEAANSLDNKLSLEFVTQYIKDALSYLDAVLGREFSEELLDRIFSEFCIGK